MQICNYDKTQARQKENSAFVFPNYEYVQPGDSSTSHAIILDLQSPSAHIIEVLHFQIEHLYPGPRVSENGKRAECRVPARAVMRS